MVVPMNMPDLVGQATTLRGLAKFWQTMEDLHSDVLTEDELQTSQDWIAAVLAIAGEVEDGNMDLGDAYRYDGE